MALPMRAIALTAITAAAVGIGTWATVRYFAHPRPGGPPPATIGMAPAPPAAPDAGHIKATLFYVAADGQRLAAAERDVLVAESPSEQGKRIIEAMLGPAPAGLVSAIPAGTTLKGLYVGERGDAYVDFSASLRANHPGGSDTEILTVYAIVSALTVNLPAITAVQILIDGHEVDTLAGHVDLRRPLPGNRQWMQKGTS
jgi:spore germination protein GerM